MKITLHLYFLLFILNSMNSQTGPGGVGNSNNNPLWLRADVGTSSTINGAPISSWLDQSGNNINVTQTVAVQQPSYTANLINGNPAIRFDNTSTTNDKLFAPDSPKLDNTSGYTFFTVVRPEVIDNEARAIISKRVNVGVDQSFMFFFFSNRRLYLDLQTNNDRFNTTTQYTTNTNYILGMHYDGTLALNSRAKLYSGETLEITARETNTLIPDNNSPLIIGSTHETDNRPFGGYIAEIITYTIALNSAQRIIVNNYLSAKYDINISANDYYAGDSPANGDYDFDVAGVGKEADGSSVTFSTSASSGMGFNVNSGLDDNEYLIAGHAVKTNSVNFSDVSGITGPNPARWERIWYIDVSNKTAPIRTDIEFDMINAGIGPVNTAIPANYVLLFRPGLSGTWTEVATGYSIAPNKVLFQNYMFNNDTQDGYYTLGTKNNLLSPLPIELIDFSALLNGSKVDITWATMSEINNSHFEIERSKNGIDFEKIFSVKGANNSSSIINYMEVDYNPYLGISYYRLKQVDFSGSFTYSKIITVKNQKSIGNINIYPNPSIGKINIDLNQIGKKEILIIVRDITGKEFYTKIHIINEDDNLIALDLEDKLSSGSYLIIASSENELYSKQITIIKP
jgi:hypothetical protein